MEFMSAKEAADKWGISQRRVAVLCSENRIPNATMVGNMWIIPQNAQKPEDARSARHKIQEENIVKPFLKWAGGKSQLLEEIRKYYPFGSNEITKYAEPFVGGGAVLFDILNKYELEAIYISDINAELINTYIVIRDNIDDLIQMLTKMQSEFLQLDTEGRKIYYYAKRELFNDLEIPKHQNIVKAALLIFLNRTCFNGLYRINKKGMFNVPMGQYKNPLICDKNNLKAVSRKLQNIQIVCGDYTASAKFIDCKTFAYFDPPYRPLTASSSFTSYSKDKFNDDEQIRLAKFVEKMKDTGAKILLSNSDPKNIDQNDHFFDEIYSNLNIKRVEATRMINRNSNARGRIKEILVSNF